jgi:hypothetical protein
LWDSFEYDRVSVSAAMIEPAYDVGLRVAGHLLALHLQQHVLKYKIQSHEILPFIILKTHLAVPKWSY